MPKPIVASFWAIREQEHPNAAPYGELLRILQRSCERLGLQHVVLTDHATAESGQWPAGLKAWVTDLPRPLMRAVTEVQAQFLESEPPSDVVLVGADCVILDDPSKRYPAEPGLCLTYRGIDSKYPVNTGAVMVRRHSMEAVASLYRRVANRCQTYWCADQAALQDELRPLPTEYPVTLERHGIKIAFLEMWPFNVRPEPDDPAEGACILHFRGKRRKDRMFDWAARNLPA